MNTAAMTDRLASRVSRHLRRWLGLMAVAALTACGGGGGSSAPETPAATQAAAPNVLSITVNRGPNNAALNTPFVSVTVCQPGTSSCQTIDRVLVDTGSYGLRLEASALDAALALPAVGSAAGEPVAQCAHFVSGYAWGSVRRADVRLAGEMASNLPVQVIGDTAAPYATVPEACRNTGGPLGNSAGRNGILGVGVFTHDCPSCVSSTAPGVYYACPASGCRGTTMPLESQVSNPVASFAVHNNGVVLSLPSVPRGGVPTLSGSLILGIGTHDNNQLGAATVFSVNSQGNFSTTYKGTTYRSSFIDSGSNALIFPDPAIPVCSDFYCPTSALTLSAVNTSSSGVSGTVEFTLESIQDLAAGAAAANVGADIGLSRTFAWGLPFFFGRTVFVAISGAATPKGPGPYWAY